MAPHMKNADRSRMLKEYYKIISSDDESSIERVEKDRNRLRKMMPRKPK